MSYVISRPWGGHCGIGHQFQNWLTGYLLASRYGLQFVHSPFCGNTTEPQIDTPVWMWEKFLGLGRGFILENEVPQDVERVALPKINWHESSWDEVTCDHPAWGDVIKDRINDNVLFECAIDQFVGLGWDHFDAEPLRVNYNHARKGWPMTIPFDYNKLNISIHVRRGDVTESGRYRVRWVGNDVYKNVICQLRSQFSDISFHIYSDGTRQELSELTDDDTTLHLRTNVFDTFHQMVSSDILMPGQSNFSVLAGHLCSGTIIGRAWSPIWDNFPIGQKFAKVDVDGQFIKD